MQRIEFLSVLRCEFLVVFKAVYGLVLGSVILKDRLYIVHLGDEHYICYENYHSQRAFGQIEQDYAVCKLRKPPYGHRRQKHKNRYSRDNGDQDGNDHEKFPGFFLAQLFFYPNIKFILFVLFRIILFKYVGRIHENFRPLDHRTYEVHNSPDDGNFAPFAGFRRRLGLHVYASVGKSYCDGRLFGAAHHYAFHYRLTAYGSRAGVL